jgi:transposase InsO family protein
MLCPAKLVTERETTIDYEGKIQITTEHQLDINVMIDCRAEGDFIDKTYATIMGIKKLALKEPIIVRNVDGTRNEAGTITHYVNVILDIGERRRHERLLVTKLGKQKIILGIPWLQRENPDIDWQQKTINWRDEPHLQPLSKVTMEEEEDEPTISTRNPTENSELLLSPDDLDNITISHAELEELWINVKTSHSQTLAHEHDQKRDIPIKELVPEEYHEWLDVFNEKASDRFPDPRPWDHAIDTKEGFEPKNFKAYALSPEEHKLQKEFVDENLEKGYIRPSKSPMASPFFFVAKKEKDKVRPTQDYRYLNDWTIKNAYPMPRADMVMDTLQAVEAKYFTKFDIARAFNNVRIKNGHQWKAAFKTHYGLFEPTVMFFGMCNSPATFQSMMDHIFKDEIHNKWIIVYMDDILIFSKTKEGLERITKGVLQKLRENDLYLKPHKCEFAKTKIEYLGMILEEGKVSMDPTKLIGIKQWPEPTTVKQVRSFLGFGNFYRRFIRSYSNVARPMNELLQKDKKFEWTMETQNAFDELKKRFTEEPVLIFPDTSKPFQIECDASKYASGAVLTQLDVNGDRHPCAFISKTFSPTERNYEIYDRELLSVIRALNEWRHYLQGSPHETTVFTDHKNLTYFRKAQKLNRRQARWSLLLSEYNIKLVHLPGSKMILADTLSRRPDMIPNEDHDNEDVTLLPDNLFINLIDMELQQKIANSTDMDIDAADALKSLLGQGPTHLRKDLEDWTIDIFDDKNILFYQGKNYIPKDFELRKKIVEKYHDPISAGHPGEIETMNAIKEHYWWPGMRSFIKNYVKGCGICQQFKINRSPSNPSYNAIPGPESTRPFANCSMDLITDLPPITLENGTIVDALMVVVDHGLTKGVVITPCAKTLTEEGAGEILLNQVYKRFGLPDSIISDRDPRFTAKAFQELLKLLGIKSKLTTAFHPQSDGTTEQFNQEIEAYLGIYCSSNPTDWHKKTGTIEFTHNNRRHSDRTKTSFELMFGSSPIAIPTAFEHTKFPAVEDKLNALRKDREEAIAAHELARRRMIERRKSNFKPFKVDQKVWLDTRNLKTRYHRKMAPKREGPFKIERVMGPLTFKLKLPITWRIHDMFHAALLMPYTETETHGPNFPQPPPDIDNDEERYEIETILNHRKRGRGYQYYVKWKGYDITEASWESATCFENGGEETLKRYRFRHHLAT